MQKRVAIVGGGPTGFFAAETLLRSKPPIAVDVYESLPTPFGLVRFGVAPDAQKTKQITRAFEKTAACPGFAFFGNVEVGNDVGFDELRLHYDAVLLAYGSQRHRTMGIPGEDLPGSVTANAFTGWYNGHPDHADDRFDLSHPVAVVVGNGNVAMDVARMLAKTPEELADTDVPEHVLAALRASNIKEIHVIGRRGPLQTSFTHPELSILETLEDCRPVTDSEDLELNEVSRAELDDPVHHNQRHNYELLSRFAVDKGTSTTRKVRLRFCWSPKALEGKGRVEKLVLQRNRLVGEPGAQRAEATERHEDLVCGLVVRCIGYGGTPLPGLPFDEKNQVIPNADGRVLSGKDLLPGIYAAGWIRHGPVGLIGTSKRDAQAVAGRMLEDLPALPRREVGDPLLVHALLKDRGVQVVDLAGWRRIDAVEQERGAALGKPREKICSRAEMLKIAAS